jgi:hypothetical protein
MLGVNSAVSDSSEAQLSRRDSLRGTMGMIQARVAWGIQGVLGKGGLPPLLPSNRPTKKDQMTKRGQKSIWRTKVNN